MSDCIFCKIISGEITSERIYEDDDIIAIRDINPRSPTHYLFIPKKHIRNLEEIDDGNYDIVGKLNLAAVKIAKKEGVAEKGFRTVINCNEWGGQTVFHLHLHLLAGRKLDEGMG